MSTTVTRIPTEVHQEVTRMAALCGESSSALLEQAWHEYVANHRDQFATDLEKAAQLMRNGTLDDLVDFVQDSHRTKILIDAEELEQARSDPKVKETLEQARETFERFESEGRNL